MTPYLESESLPPGRRRPVAFLAAALMILPAGALLPGAHSSPLVTALAIIALLVLAPILGLAFATPRRITTVDAGTGLVTRRTTGELPDPRGRTQEWPMAAVARAEVVARGTTFSPTWGVQLVLHEGEPVELRAHRDPEAAQNVIDHLAMLGIPGPSREVQRAAALDAALTPPEL